jgi:hypothetical protein
MTLPLTCRTATRRSTVQYSCWACLLSAAAGHVRASMLAKRERVKVSWGSPTNKGRLKKFLSTPFSHQSKRCRGVAILLHPYQAKMIRALQQDKAYLVTCDCPTASFVVHPRKSLLFFPCGRPNSVQFSFIRTPVLSLGVSFPNHVFSGQFSLRALVNP